MIIPMLVKVDFGALGQIRRHVKGIGVTLFVNWLVKPFSMALSRLALHSACFCLHGYRRIRSIAILRV